VHARLQRRIGTICAIYGCPVEITAEPIEPSSRSLRVTALRRRLAVMGRRPVATAVVEAEDISLPSISNHCQRGLASARYLPTNRIANESGTLCPRAGRPPGEGAGAGVNSAVISSNRSVLRSRVSVFARGCVCSVCSTTKLVGLFSFTIVNVPSPCELNASIVFESKTAPSDPLPIGNVSRIFPLPAFKITIVCGLRQDANRILFFTSIANPAQVPPLPCRSYVAVTFKVFASKTATLPLSSRSTYT